MNITISEQLKPFTHLPGQMIPLPGSHYAVQPFPALLRVYSLKTATPSIVHEISIDIQGPMKEFTAQLDLEKGKVNVWGRSRSGKISYKIQGSKSGWGLYFDRLQENGICITEHEGKERVIHKNDWLLFDSASKFIPFSPGKQERLSFGSHKSQDWIGINKRESFTEIFPIWFRLGQQMPEVANHQEGTCALLLACHLALKEAKPEDLLNPFYDLWKVGFDGLMAPRLQDSNFQGIPVPLLKREDVSSLLLLSEGAKLIRRMFCIEEEGQVSILPRVAPEFHAGRFCDVNINESLNIDIEWSKKNLRKLVLRPSRDTKIKFRFPSYIKKFRIRERKKEKGVQYPSPQVLSLENGKVYLIDNFEK